MNKNSIEKYIQLGDVNEQMPKHWYLCNFVYDPKIYFAEFLAAFAKS